MPALLNDLSIIHHADKVCVADRTEAVGNDDGGSAA